MTLAMFPAMGTSLNAITLCKYKVHSTGEFEVGVLGEKERRRAGNQDLAGQAGVPGQHQRGPFWYHFLVIGQHRRSI
jgi:hypothetical protein